MLITKITDGHVTQVFDAETGKCVKQSFVASDKVEWVTTIEDYDTTIIVTTYVRDFYHPFAMEQPNVRKP